MSVSEQYQTNTTPRYIRIYHGNTDVIDLFIDLRVLPTARIIYLACMAWWLTRNVWLLAWTIQWPGSAQVHRTRQLLAGRAAVPAADAERAPEVRGRAPGDLHRDRQFD